MLNMFKADGEMSYVCGRLDLLLHHCGDALHLRPRHGVTGHVQTRALHLAFTRSQLGLVRTSSLFSMSLGRTWKWK